MKWIILIKKKKNLVDKYNKQQITYQENIQNDVNSKIQQEQDNINKDIANHKEKVDSFNNMVKDQNNGTEIDVEKMKQLYSEIESLTKTLQEKKVETPKKIEDIKKKAKEELNIKLEEFKQKFNEENENLQKKNGRIK